MIPIIISLIIVFCVWVLVTVLHQKEDIATLKQQLKLLTFKVFYESEAKKSTENEQADSTVRSVIPQSAQTVASAPTPEFSGTENPASDKPITAKKVLKWDMESMLGRNVIGIMASVLVFIGLVFLGVLAYGHITETGKIIAMYVISSIILGLGIGLTVKKRNNFTLILMGCGCGSFFISILLTYIYFNKINGIVASSLLLVWMAATLLLSKKVSSILLSIVAHIGMAVSICFAFAQGLDDEKLVILLIYQGMAIAVILLGNVFCCRKTYNFGVFVSLALTIITSSFMWERFALNSSSNPIASPFATALPTALIASAFIAQFLCSCFLSYLLSVSITRLKSGKGQTIIHLANKALWIASLFINVYSVVFSLADITNDPSRISTRQNFYAVFFAVLVTLVVVLIHAAFTIFLSLKFNFNRKLETISTLLLSGVASILLLELWLSNLNSVVEISAPRIIWLIVISLLLILAGRVAKNKAYSLAATVIMVIDALFMLADGYGELNNFGTVLLPLGYLVLYILIILLQWYLLDSEGKAAHSDRVRLFTYFLTEISLISIFLTSSLEFKTEILLITLTLLNTILYLVRFDRGTKKSSVMHWAFAANEFVLLSVVSGFIAFAQTGPTSSVLYMLLAALAFGLAFIRIRKVLDGNNSIESIWAGIKLTILVLAVIEGNTTWFEQSYIFSIVCMLTALPCIIFGFIGRAKTLRYYGLALTLTCILKLVTYDVTNLNIPLRVLTFIGGGIICFIISAIYNYASKKLVQIQNNDVK